MAVKRHIAQTDGPFIDLRRHLWLKRLKYWLKTCVYFWRRPKLKDEGPPSQASSLPVAPKSETQTCLRCGHLGAAERLSHWAGLPSCYLAAQHDDGFLLCPYGCLALGDCIRACPFGAIQLDLGLFPVVNPHLCQGCGTCQKSCPKGLLVSAPKGPNLLIPCASLANLKQNAKFCPRSCLGCGKCRKACPGGAISRPNAQGAFIIDEVKCRLWRPQCQEVCRKVCPRGIITSI